MDDVRLPDPTKKCEIPDCDRMQEGIVYDRDEQKIYLACDPCIRRIVDSGGPEYRECCPNCGCAFGVN
jgi:hypothetical protein